MKIGELADFLAYLKEGAQLDDFELLAMRIFDRAAMRYEVEIAYGPLVLLVTYPMTPEQVRKSVAFYAGQVIERQAPS